jgi:hypothetical protein
VTAAVRLGTVVVLLAAGVGVGHLTGDAPPPAGGATAVPVVRATAVCPDVRQEGTRGATTVTAGATGSGRLTGGPLGSPADLLQASPLARDLATEVSGGAYVVQAEGPAAAGLIVEQATRATSGSRRGVAALSCPAPGTSAWFVGGSTLVGTATELLLVNVESTPARVDITAWTADGPTDTRPGSGIVVPARGRAAVPLDRLAPDRDLLAVHVRSTTGQVAAALRAVRVDGLTPLGVDWVPQGQPPAAEVVVPGLPAGPGRRTLLVTNPGERDAVVSVELTTDDGQYVPEGLDALAVPAGTTVAQDLSEQLADTPAAVRVRSDGPPLLAGAEVVDRQEGAVRERSYASSVPALTGPVLLADVRLSPPTEVWLLLSALADDAVVEVAPVAAPGELPEPRRVEVPQGTTVPVRLSRFLPPGSTGSLGIEVRPVSGAVHAARFSRERGSTGPLTTVLPLRTPPATVVRPAVVADR